MTFAPLPKGSAVIVGVGARTHAGLTALQTAMSVRAKKMHTTESHMIDRFGEPIAMCRLASLPDNAFGGARYLALAAPALALAAQPWLAGQRLRTQTVAPLPLLLAVAPANRPDVDSRSMRALLPRLQEESGVPLDLAKSALIAQDRAGGVVALMKAMQLLASGSSAVIVGGVDSYFDPDLVEWLDKEMRLHSLNAENGFIPGEAAAFFVLSRRSDSSAMHIYAEVLGAAMQAEPRPFGSPEPTHSLGMTKALRDAAAPSRVEPGRIPWTMTDVVNERHRVDEWQIAAARCFRMFTPEMVHHQPLLVTGDVGAASAPLMVTIAASLWQAGAAPGDCAMLALHSDGAERGAILLRS